MGKSLLSNTGGKNKIFDQVNHEMALKKGEIKEIKSDEEEEDEQEDIRIGELMCLCEKMGCLQGGRKFKKLHLGFQFFLVDFR